MSNSLYVFAKITPKADFFDNAKDAIISILTTTRSEAGCIQFNLYDSNGDGSLYVFEEWENQAALDIHYAMEYTKSVFDSYQSWLQGPVEITKLAKVG